eukprot:4797874-Alexandrium_andersonii.AAC.1
MDPMPTFQDPPVPADKRHRPHHVSRRVPEVDEAAAILELRVLRGAEATCVRRRGRSLFP